MTFRGIPKDRQYWRSVHLLCFLALDAEHQGTLTSRGKEWFITETEANLGANFLIGIAAAFVEYHRLLLDRLPDRDAQLLTEMNRRFEEMFQGGRTDPRNWSRRALDESENWQFFRRPARIVLGALGEECSMNPPLQIDKLIDVTEIGGKEV